MSVPVVLRPVAQDEADEAARWYEGKQAGLGADFLAELQRVLQVISGQPDRYPVVLGDTRGPSGPVPVLCLLPGASGPRGGHGRFPHVPRSVGLARACLTRPGEMPVRRRPVLQLDLLSRRYSRFLGRTSSCNRWGRHAGFAPHEVLAASPATDGSLPLWLLPARTIRTRHPGTARGGSARGLGATSP
jgi:hypothetical protein